MWSGTPAGLIEDGAAPKEDQDHERPPQPAASGDGVSLLLGAIAVVAAIVWLVTIADLLRRHLGTSRTVAWLLIVLIVPLLGAALYWALRGPEAGPAGGTHLGG